MKTKKDQVLAHLRRGWPITQLQALRLYGSLRLGAIIHSLRKEYGKDYIITELIDVEDKFGGKSRIGRYSLRICLIVSL